jgi:predicted acyltransferase
MRKALLPLTIYGLNALFIFAFSGFVARMLIAVKPAGTSLKAGLYEPLRMMPMAPENASLAFALAFNLAMFAIAWFLWKRRWFVKA